MRLLKARRALLLSSLMGQGSNPPRPPPARRASTRRATLPLSKPCVPTWGISRRGGVIRGESGMSVGGPCGPSAQAGRTRLPATEVAAPPPEKGNGLCNGDLCVGPARGKQL